MCGHPAPRREARKEAARNVALSTYECGGIGSYSSGDISSPLLQSGADKGHGCVALIAGGDGSALIGPTHTLRGEGFDASEDGTGRGTPRVPVSIQDVRGVDKAQNGKGWSDEGVSYTVDTHATQGVAFTQNTRDEVRYIGGDGQIAGALAAESGMKQTTYIAFSAKDHGGDATENMSPTLRAGGHSGSHANAGVMPAVAFHNRQDPDVSGDVTHPIGAKDNGLGVFYGGQGAKAGSIAYSNEVAPTLKASDSGANRAPSAHVGTAVRRLTPIECERLQGFPDNFTAIPWRKKDADNCPDGPRYKALGNSMAVPVMRWIGERIQLVDDLTELL